MIIQATFDYRGQHHVFSRSIDEFDRNYNDEEYAYFLEPFNNEESIYEINILKNDEGEILEDGYTAIYTNIDTVAPDDIISTSFVFM